MVKLGKHQTVMNVPSKARQWSKLKQIKSALVESGYTALDQQAQALGLSRSTTWSIVQCKHKSTGLSTAVLLRMLSNPQLPAAVRVRLSEYVDEKAAGLYGDTPHRRRQFASRLQRDRHRTIDIITDRKELGGSSKFP